MLGSHLGHHLASIHGMRHPRELLLARVDADELNLAPSPSQIGLAAFKESFSEQAADSKDFLPTRMMMAMMMRA